MTPGALPPFMAAFIVHHPFWTALLAPLCGAVLLDLVQFAGTKDPEGWVKGFSLKLALYRYAQSLVGAFAGLFGVSAVGATAGAVVGLVLYWCF